MKREAFNHPKMLDLAARLNVTTTHARGILATLWNWAADAAHLGDVGKWSDGVIARACDWSGDPSEFVEHLVGSGWLDRCAVHRLVIHDLDDHAPDWWKSKVKRFKKSFVIATPITEPSQIPEASVSANGSANETANGSATSILCSALQTSANQTSANTPAAHPLLDEPAKPQPKRASPKPAYEPNGALLPASLDVPPFREAWNRWIVYRRNKRKPVSVEAAAEQLETFARYGPDIAIESIRQSITSDWQGLFPEKVVPNGRRSTSTSPQHNAQQRLAGGFDG